MARHIRTHNLREDHRYIASTKPFYVGMKEMNAAVVERLKQDADTLVRQLRKQPRYAGHTDWGYTLHSGNLRGNQVSGFYYSPYADIWAVPPKEVAQSFADQETARRARSRGDEIAL